MPPEQSATRRRSHLAALLVGDLPLAQRTWALWTLGRIAPGDADGDAFFTAEKIDRINALRILGFRAAKSARPISPAVIAALTDAEPRVRLAAVLALRETRQGMDALIASLSAEKDRVSFLAAWQALREIAKPDKLRALLRDERAGVRRAALLALLEDRVLTAEEAALFTKDSDAPLAQTAALYVVKIGGQPAPAAAVKDDGWPLRIAPANLSTASGRAAAVSALRVGAHAYTDRTYTLTRVPEALAGATFLQTPNEDSGSRGAGALAFDLPMAATVSRRKTPQRPRAFRALNLPGAPLSPLTTAPFGTATADVLNDREMSGSQVRITTADRTKFENAPTRRVEGVERNRPGATFLPLTFFTA